MEPNIVQPTPPSHDPSNGNSNNNMNSSVQPDPAQYLDQLFPEATPPPKQSSKWRFIIIIALITSLSVGITIFSFSQTNTEKNKSETVNESDIDYIKTDESLDVVNLQSNKLVLTPLVDFERIIKSQDIKANTNKQINLSDGFSFAVLEYKTVDRIVELNKTPTPGSKYIVTNIIYGNRSKSSINAYYGSVNMKLTNGKVIVADKDVSLLFIGNEDIKGFVLEPGKQKAIKLVFQIPNSAEAKSIVYKKSYTDSEQNVNNSSGKEISVLGSVLLK